MQNRKLKHLNILFGLLFGLLFFPSGVKSLIIACFALFTVYLSFRNKLTIKKPFIINGVIYILLLFTLFYSNDLNYGVKKLLTMSSLIVFPILFSMLGEERLKAIYLSTTNLLWIYIISVLLFNIVPFLWFYITNYSFLEIIRHYPYVIVVDIGKYSIHPIYMAMHCSISILFSLFLYSNSKKKLALVILITLFVLFLIIYARKGPMISLTFTLLIWLLLNLKNKSKKYVKIFLVALVVLFVFVPKTRKRFLELNNIEVLSKENENSTNIRYSIYKNTIELITKAPILGYGIGDYDTELSKQYALNDEKQLLEKNYNSHNQYLGFMIIGGLFMTFFFVGSQMVNIKLSLKKDNPILVLLIVFFLVLMLFENILEREYGVIFYALFINYFSIKNLS